MKMPEPASWVSASDVEGALRARFRDVRRSGLALTAACPNTHENPYGETLNFRPNGSFIDCTGGCSLDQVMAAAEAEKYVPPPEVPAHITRKIREAGEDDGERAPRFRLESLSALLAEEIPPIKWLLTPYVPACSFGELVGPPGKGKTTFMAWMVMQMAKAGYRCAIIQEEGSRGGLQRLLRRALEAVGGDISDRVYFMHAQHVNLLSKSDVVDLSIILKGYDFVLFDSFNLVTPGLDEDKARDMGPVISDMLKLKKDLSIAPWFNHHSGKSKWKPGEVPHLGDGRGSSALPGALDAELSMRPIAKPMNGFIQFDMFVTKMREADDQVRPRRVSIARTGPAAVVEMTELDETAAEVDGHLALAILNFIKAAGTEGTSKNKVENNVSGDSNKIRDALMALKYSGQVEEIQHGKYTKWRVR